jgi:hypothetical protein
MLLVFTGYIPDEHYLAELGRLVTNIDPGFADCFPSADSFQIDAFALLEYAYVGARYDKRYTIDEASLSYLVERVAALLALTRERCEAKIAGLEAAARSDVGHQR